MLVFGRHPKTIKFYGSARAGLSDRSGDMIAFMHRSTAATIRDRVVKADGPGLHHLSWTASINEIGLGAMQMADKCFVAGWGLAAMCWDRTTHYVREPWGSYSEYSSTSTTSGRSRLESGDHPPEIRSMCGPDAAGRLRVQPRGAK